LRQYLLKDLHGGHTTDTLHTLGVVTAQQHRELDQALSSEAQLALGVHAAEALHELVRVEQILVHRARA
jgi:hypothetical protein